MSDNLDEENSGNPINNQSENSSDDNTPTKDTETITPNQDTETMEVHAHDLHKAPGHGWKHYTFEFLMLFLAVFCGFLAENQREQLAEHQREKEYIKNLLQDLKQDTTALSSNIRSRERRRIAADSLIYLLSIPFSQETQNNIHIYANHLTAVEIFNYSNSTIQQLKSSGLMRLIRKADLVNRINAYDLRISRHKVREENELLLTLEYEKVISSLLDATTIETIGDSLVTYGFNQPERALKKPVYKALLTTDPDKINRIKGLAALLYNRNLVNYFWLIRFREQATDIIELIKKEYGLE